MIPGTILQSFFPAGWPQHVQVPGFVPPLLLRVKGQLSVTQSLLQQQENWVLSGKSIHTSKVMKMYSCFSYEERKEILLNK